MIDLSKAYELF